MMNWLQSPAKELTKLENRFQEQETRSLGQGRRTADIR